MALVKDNERQTQTQALQVEVRTRRGEDPRAVTNASNTAIYLASVVEPYLGVSRIRFRMLFPWHYLVLRTLQLAILYESSRSTEKHRLEPERKKLSPANESFRFGLQGRR